jgi:hypothetical protein
LRSIGDVGSDESRHPEELRDALFTDDDLARHGITLFGAGLDRARGGIRVRVAAEDAERACAEIRRRYGDRVDVEVVAARPYVVEDVPWECWTADAGDRVTVWLMDYTDGSKLRASHRESDEAVVITVGGPRWQGAHHDMGHIVRRDITLNRPLAGRRVVDGATGDVRPNRALVT